eukprot:TRINITY_DN4540_c0_g1_i2.p1 TRINITY_DN4540_c0_g1~~TRINITY_DN4540_c0_g1_i2.p1  ORF type:complete len:323 (+),score=72.26 TRINITY_DN4540_c0_g1_i2:30-971(+)
MEASTTTSTTPAETSLLQEYTKGCDLWAEIEEACCSKDPQYKQLVTDAIKAFQTAAVIVKMTDLYSKNEELNDINTASLQFLSIPYYLGCLYQKVPTLEHSERLAQMKLSKQYLDEFTETCIRLKLFTANDIEAMKRTGEAPPDVRRTEKIERYKREKELNEKLKVIMKQKIDKSILSMLDDEEADDGEFERETSILLLQLSAIKTFEALNLVKQEIEILEHMIKLMSENNGQLPVVPKPEPSQFKPLVIGDPRHQIAKNAFRPGWNLPTVSIEEAGMIDYQVALEQQKRTQEKEKQYVKGKGKGEWKKIRNY